MALRKIDLMHREFGFSPGNKCRTCDNFSRERYHDYKHSKCAIYGLTHSEASDWSGRYDACGKYNQEYDGRPIIESVRSWPVPEDPLPGQQSLFGEETE